jgi:hypothetical protein
MKIPGLPLPASPQADSALQLLQGAKTSAVAPPAFQAGSVFSALLKQLYIDQHYVPRSILVPVDFADRDALCTLLTERSGHRIELAVPQRGEKRSLVDLAGQNAKQSYTQRFRVLEPSRKAIQEALADTLMLPELPRRIECFDISHIQGAETVASLVVWEDGKMNKQLYRKFKVMTVVGVDDFASMREVVIAATAGCGERQSHCDNSRRRTQRGRQRWPPRIQNWAKSLKRIGESKGRKRAADAALAHPHRRRPGPAARRGRGARVARPHLAAAGLHRQARRSDLPLRQRRRADCA